MEAFTIGHDKPQGVPAGAYQATFLGYKETDSKNGAALLWQWVVTNGEHAGQTAVAWTDPPTKTEPKPSNHFGRLLSGLAGKPLTGGEIFHPATVIGKSFTIMVAPGPKGGAVQVRQVAPPM